MADAVSRYVWTPQARSAVNMLVAMQALHNAANQVVLLASDDMLVDLLKERSIKRAAAAAKVPPPLPPAAPRPPPAVPPSPPTSVRARLPARTLLSHLCCAAPQRLTAALHELEPGALQDRSRFQPSARLSFCCTPLFLRWVQFQ